MSTDQEWLVCCRVPWGAWHPEVEAKVLEWFLTDKNRTVAYMPCRQLLNIILHNMKHRINKEPYHSDWQLLGSILNYIIIQTELNYRSLMIWLIVREDYCTMQCCIHCNILSMLLSNHGIAENSKARSQSIPFWDEKREPSRPKDAKNRCRQQTTYSRDGTAIAGGRSNESLGLVFAQSLYHRSFIRRFLKWISIILVC